VNYDITALLDKEIRKEAKSIESEIDKEINAVDIKSSCESAWLQLQKDIPIGNYGYLQLAPNAISLSKLHYDKNQINFNLGIELFPTLKTEKTEIKPKLLPNLTDFKQKEGFEMINAQPKEGADNKLICFLHPKSTGGILVELCQEIDERA
jgi:hypothetical protein